MSRVVHHKTVALAGECELLLPGSVGFPAVGHQRVGAVDRCDVRSMSANCRDVGVKRISLIDAGWVVVGCRRKRGTRVRLSEEKRKRSEVVGAEEDEESGAGRTI